MKKFLQFLFPCLLLALCSATLTGCSSDPDDPDPVDPFEVMYTTWVSTSNYAESGLQVTQTTKLEFFVATARLSFITEVSDGKEKETSTTIIDYTFRRAINLVILQPAADEANRADLEGTIENGIKMTLKNVSSGSEVATLYKQ